MSALPLVFGSPLLLAGLAALPLIWWLLRMTPPRPQEEVFPPFRILASIFKRDETPSKSPWWMTLLRLALAGLVILALANPVWNPRASTLSGDQPLAIVVDNGWASAQDWPQRIATAERLIADANSSGAPIYLLGTAERSNVDIGPVDAARASERLHALTPRPIMVDRKAAFERITQAARPNTRIAYLSDGIAQNNDDAAFSAIKDNITSLTWYRPDTSNLVALTQIENSAETLDLQAIRPLNANNPRNLLVGAFDDKGRRIAEAALNFAANSHQASAQFRLPVELRNDFASLQVDAAPQAGATRLIDGGSKRRSVALISGSDADMAQPLLSPLYYISKALAPFSDLIRPRTADLLQAVPELLDQKPAVVIMADIGKLPEPAEQRLSEWVEKGGTLIRFAGPRLAGASDDDTLLPVQLRRGERALGGTLSWTEPQKLASFPDHGPFAGLTAPQDVVVNRQVLAEPSADLFDKSFANLSDGTPLVTGEKRGLGQLVLFHIAPDASWSNLPISGSFVEMLRRVVTLSRANDASTSDMTASLSLPPFLTLSADGTLMPPHTDAKPLVINKGEQPQASFDTPPGFYGSEDALFALNLFDEKAKLEPITAPKLNIAVSQSAYAVDESIALRGPFLAAAAILLAIDTALMLWLGGAFRRRLTSRATVKHLALMVFAASAFTSLGHTPPANAQTSYNDSKPGDDAIINAVSKTHLAYIITGKTDTDDLSKAGLRGLTYALYDKTALEPGDPIGVDPAKDELAFYPLLYWPIDADAPIPTPEAIAKVDAYMQQGGTVLFDTRDQLEAGTSLDASGSPANQRLRAILDGMNVPPLEPVPTDHVLSKSFFIMPDFPGRFRGSPLWVEASVPDRQNLGQSVRPPVRSGDGVSPILITANDFAGAWAVDELGEPLLPTVPNDPMQRIYALRGGVNIVMYMLTGNYKSDQVHVPALLERLGN